MLISLLFLLLALPAQAEHVRYTGEPSPAIESGIVVRVIPNGSEEQERLGRVIVEMARASWEAGQWEERRVAHTIHARCVVEHGKAKAVTPDTVCR